MGKTKRKVFKGGWRPSDGKCMGKGGDTQVDHHRYGNRKMKPYAKDKSPMKHKASGSDCYQSGYMKRISKSEKLEAKNANRSLKKGFRQQLKRELRKELELI